jgi:hypothetical protein
VVERSAKLSLGDDRVVLKDWALSKLKKILNTHKGQISHYKMLNPVTIEIIRKNSERLKVPAQKLR